MKVLHIDCSVRNEQSISRALSGYFLEQLKNNKSDITVDYLDLAEQVPDHVSALFIEGNYSMPDARTPEMVAELAVSEGLIERMHAADVYVIGMPMYNFSIPSNFKAFIDNVTRIGRTFTISEAGFKGLLTDKKVYVINTRGVDFTQEMIAPMDQLVPYLKTVFQFMGLDDVAFINVHPVKFGDEAVRLRSINNAKEEITTLAHQL